MRETPYMARIQVEAARAGVVLYRNNVGAAKDGAGRLVRYGLCVGSSDLIGWRPLTITPDMVGATFAQFVAVETKGARTRITPAQERFIDVVRAGGGFARVARVGVDEIEDVIAELAKGETA